MSVLRRHAREHRVRSIVTTTTIAALLLAACGEARAQPAPAPPPPAPPPPAPPPPAPPPPAPPAPPPVAKGDVLQEHPFSASVIAGSSIAINGLNYNLGVGVRAGMNIAHFYVGGLLALHQGDSKTITWGPTAFSNGGDQKYTSHPFFFAADAGYSFLIPLGTVSTVLTPCLSGGLLLITMDTSGVYGSQTIAQTYGIFGFGASYGLLFNERFTAGAHFRLYDTGDTKFSFGDLSKGTYEHGFSTSIFYYALFAELGYRF